MGSVRGAFGRASRNVSAWGHFTGIGAHSASGVAAAPTNYNYAEIKMRRPWSEERRYCLRYTAASRLEVAEPDLQDIAGSHCRQPRDQQKTESVNPDSSRRQTM